jgi:hypothetical protein
MKYAVEMGSGAMIYIIGFAETGSAIKKLIARTHRQHGVALGKSKVIPVQAVEALRVARG